MQNELTSLNESSDFACPNCGTTAFEAEGSRWDYNNGYETDGQRFLVMRCLRCLQSFRHTLHDKEFCFDWSTSHEAYSRGQDSGVL